MRLNIVHPGAGELRYEIRGIVRLAQKLADTGMDMTMENIGDPVAKGEQVPMWIRELVAAEAESNEAYGYSPTKGLAKAREFLAATRNAESGSSLTPENILFFNGLGDAITKLYTWLNPVARVLGPNPAYPTHSSIEGAHGRSPMLTYNLDPSKGWLPDMEDIRNKVKYNPNIAALLVINPDNPTGTVYPREVLQAFADIAREYNLFLIADEIYAKLAFDAENFTSVAEVAGDLPTIIMRGLSKEVPWPGSRCGWLEFYNLERDDAFARYALSIEEAKMTEVCSTTLPQTVLPHILGDRRYEPHLKQRREKYRKRAREAVEVLGAVPHFQVVEPKGAFYLSVTLKEELLKQIRNKPAHNAEAEGLLREALGNVPAGEFDKEFCYRLMAATGICTVPLTSGFNSYVPGFRMTLLEEDDALFTRTLQAIANFVI